MKIKNTSQYNEVLRKIDALLDQSVLSDNQTQTLKSLLTAVDNYQLKLFKNQIPAQYKLVNDFIKVERELKN